MIEFKPWPKTPRLNRDITVTEKLDGTNSAVHIVRVADCMDLDFDGTFVSDPTLVRVDDEVYRVGAQSRNRLITPGKSTDNYGFAGWVYEHAEMLAGILGEGTHYGEWWGQGIARKYDMDRKVFSLFNVHRYARLVRGEEEANWEPLHPQLDVVPVLYQGPFSQDAINGCLATLAVDGSQAAPGFAKPEGVIVYHSASKQVYKVLLENDNLPKGAAA